MPENVLQKGRDMRVLMVARAILARDGLKDEILEHEIAELLKKALHEQRNLTDDDRAQFIKKLEARRLEEAVRSVIQRPLHFSDMQLVIPGLYISSAMTAYDKKMLKAEGITHICQCMDGKPPYPDSFQYLVLPVLDHESANLKSRFYESNEFILTARDDPAARILIHCQAGISRSATVMIAYLMYELHISGDQALALVRAARPFVRPNDGFAKQLVEFECELFEARGWPARSFSG
ncbi:MAG TPA: dual specificity protein phosphatase [Blastocatellia bacterium]|nr:dual specificity protein phosphatase [Blastocatellia bacterium]